MSNIKKTYTQLDFSKLEKLKTTTTKSTARCPACAETGGDSDGNHLFVNPDGKFGCVLYQGLEGKPHRQRIAELVGLPPETREKSEWTAQKIAAHEPAESDFNHYKHGQPVARWRYVNTDGILVGYVARFNLSNSKKETLPLSYCRDQHGQRRWIYKGFATPSPLYGLPLDDDFCVLVEGEKCRDALTAAGFPAVTWQGGSGAIHKADFSPLAGKTVVIWPDNDEPGKKAAASLIAKLMPICDGIKIVTIPPDMPEGWDAADTDLNTINRLLDAAVDHIPEIQPDIFEERESPQSRNRILSMPFSLLGMDSGIMRYMPDNGQHIVSMTPSGHTKNNLMQLAPLQDWESEFPTKSGIDWDAAVNCLIQKNQSLPKFDPRNIRGRGCWIDGADIVYHAGDKLSVNGSIKSIPQYDSAKIYESGLAIPMDLTDPANDCEAAQLIDLCNALAFDNPLYGRLLAGWLALAPICGALKWRPHIWLTAPAGSGKSWILENIINPAVGSSAVFVQGNTSEAGIRGRLGSDALPVMFDESETNTQIATSRMESVFELARQSSSESGAVILKGTQTGGSISYMVRSMFCFSSVQIGISKKADMSRISTLGIKKTDDPAQFNEVKKIWKNTTSSNAYCARIRARSICNAAVIRINAEIFSDCATVFTGDKRSADQIGTLLAGAHSLTSTQPITVDAATAWLAQQDWTLYRPDVADNDENQCLMHLYQSLIRIEREGKAAESLSVDEIITRIGEWSNPEPEKAALIRHGLKWEVGFLSVANKHQGLNRMFANTPWGDGKWKNQLLRVSGTSSKQVRFGAQITQRSVVIPLNAKS